MSLQSRFRSSAPFDGSLFLHMNKIRTCSRKNCIVGGRTFANTSCCFTWEVPVDECSPVLFDTGVLRPATSVQRQSHSGLRTLTRTCGDSGCGWTKPIFYRPSKQNIVGGSRNFEACICERSNGCRGCGKDSRRVRRSKHPRTRS